MGNVAAEEKDAKVIRLMAAVSNAVIAPEEARPYLLTSERLIPDEKAYKKHTESRKPKAVKTIKNPAYPNDEE